MVQWQPGRHARLALSPPVACFLRWLLHLRFLLMHELHGLSPSQRSFIAVHYHTSDIVSGSLPRIHWHAYRFAGMAPSPSLAGFGDLAVPSLGTVGVVIT